jgi:hypothetical protein
MTIPPTIREKVRRRAAFACEFCGIGETDTGGQLTIEHFHPKSKGGSDDLDNLVYCCACCNQYKLDYWPAHPGEPTLWNPRGEPASKHFLELDDGKLYPLTTIGAFTLRRLRLNRPQLIAHRLHRRQQAENATLLSRYRDLMQVYRQLLLQQAVLMEEQQKLLEQQRELLELLLGNGT